MFRVMRVDRLFASQQDAIHAHHTKFTKLHEHTQLAVVVSWWAAPTDFVQREAKRLRRHQSIVLSSPVRKSIRGL